MAGKMPKFYGRVNFDDSLWTVWVPENLLASTEIRKPVPEFLPAGTQEKAVQRETNHSGRSDPDMTDKRHKSIPRKFRVSRLKKDPVHCWIDGKPVRPRFNFLRCDGRRKRVRPLTTRAKCSSGFQFFPRITRLIANIDISYLYHRPYPTVQLWPRYWLAKARSLNYTSGRKPCAGSVRRKRNWRMPVMRETLRSLK